MAVSECLRDASQTHFSRQRLDDAAVDKNKNNKKERGNVGVLLMTLISSFTEPLGNSSEE